MSYLFVTLYQNEAGCLGLPFLQLARFDLLDD